MPGTSNLKTTTGLKTKISEVENKNFNSNNITNYSRI